MFKHAIERCPIPAYLYCAENAVKKLPVVTLEFGELSSVTKVEPAGTPLTLIVHVAGLPLLHADVVHCAEDDEIVKTPLSVH